MKKALIYISISIKWALISTNRFFKMLVTPLNILAQAPRIAAQAATASSTVLSPALRVFSRVSWKPLALAASALAVTGFALYQISTRVFPDSSLAKMFQSLFSKETRGSGPVPEVMRNMFPISTQMPQVWANNQFGDISAVPDGERAITDRMVRYLRNFQIHDKLLGGVELGQLHSLEKDQFLETQALDMGMDQIRTKHAAYQRGNPREYFLSANFMDTLSFSNTPVLRSTLWNDGVMKGISTDLSQTQLFRQGRVFIPMRSEIRAHWTLAFVDFAKKTVYHYDSKLPEGEGERAIVLGQNEAACNSLKDFILKNIQNKVDAEGNSQGLNMALRNASGAEWEIKEIDTPQQDNGIDCGIFALRIADELRLKRDVENLELKVKQADIPFYRFKILYDVMQKLSGV